MEFVVFVIHMSLTLWCEGADDSRTGSVCLGWILDGNITSIWGRDDITRVVMTSLASGVVMSRPFSSCVAVSCLFVFVVSTSGRRPSGVGAVLWSPLLAAKM
jgi:hypothetical protein